MAKGDDKKQSIAVESAGVKADIVDDWRESFIARVKENGVDSF